MQRCFLARPAVMGNAFAQETDTLRTLSRLDGAILNLIWIKLDTLIQSYIHAYAPDLWRGFVSNLAGTRETSTFQIWRTCLQFTRALACNLRFVLLSIGVDFSAFAISLLCHEQIIRSVTAGATRFNLWRAFSSLPNCGDSVRT